MPSRRPRCAGWSRIFYGCLGSFRRLSLALVVLTVFSILPWVSFASDAGSIAAEGPFLKSNPHPRAYGNFARWLAKYVRDEKLVPLEEGIRRLSALPAENLGLEDRGLLREGMFADVAVFDPATIEDRATYEQPHQYAVGVRHVLVNGVPVLRDGEHTGATPGRAVWGRGRTGAN